MAGSKAISTYKTYLMYKVSEAYQKLCDISSYPDLGGDPEQIEVTTLSDNMQTFIPGIKSNDAMSFDSYYDHETYARIAALEGEEQEFAIYFGDDGAEGKFTFSGYVAVRVAGAGVNEAVPMTITITPNSVITDSTGA